MTPRKDNGGQAFPMHERDDALRGMTLRDWFAGLRMQAAVTNPTGADGFTFDQRAEWAYQQADAMLAARGGGE